MRIQAFNVRPLLKHKTMQQEPSSNMQAFREIVKNAKHVAIITGAGCSAESGIPIFRGTQGLWRQFPPEQLATPQAFRKNPSLEKTCSDDGCLNTVWEFYHYRRELVLTKSPNRAHYAIAEFEKRLTNENKRVVLITTNVDNLHQKAGSQNIIQLHGSLFRTRCTKCFDVQSNYNSPICAALKDKGFPDPTTEDARIPLEELPQCHCGGLLRPDVVWFGEGLDENNLVNAGKEVKNCDLCLVVGTSSIVMPAAGLALQVSSRDVPVAEFNLESTPVTGNFKYHFSGPCGDSLPEALDLGLMENNV